MRFLKGLANPQVRAKVENLTYLLPATFNAVEAAASHHEKHLRREKLARSTTTHIAGTTTEPEKILSDIGETVKPKGDSLQRIILDLKREPAVQKQQIARMQLDNLRQTKPERPCLHCGATDHFKRNCPDLLAKRGVVSQATMTELFEMDLATVDEVACVEEAIQRLQAFIADTEFTPNMARQVTLVDLGEQEGLEFLSRAMAGVTLEEGEYSDDPKSCPEKGGEVSTIRQEAKHIMELVRMRKA